MRLTTKAAGVLVIVCILTFFLPLANMKQGPNECTVFQNEALAYNGEHKELEPFEQEQEVVPDPMESLNRGFFKFNDKLYFWFLKPVSQVYGTVIPQGLRIAIRHAFHNIAFPIRFVNCALQGKGKAMGTETARFVINSTLGLGGLVDFAGREYKLYPKDEDFGQTLGVWGMKPVAHTHLPLLGPSNLRDSIGLVGDYFLNPIYWLSPNWYKSTGIKTGKEVNATSLRIGEYEDFKKSAIDPYVSMRDAYHQYRVEEIKN